MDLQKTKPPMNGTEEGKPEAPVLITSTIVELKINAEILNKQVGLQMPLSVAGLEARAVAIIKNEDNLKEMAEWLDDLDKLEDIATDIHKIGKKPYLEGGQAWDAGKKLVFEHFARLRAMVKPDYDRLLEALDTKKQNAATKEATDKAIKKGIEVTTGTFVKLIVTASSKDELARVERLVNLEKSPSRATKYGDFHQQAIKKFDETLLPNIRSQKIKLNKLNSLRGALEEAVSDSESAEAGRLETSISEVTEELRQSKAAAEEILSQEFFPVEEAEEVLPEIRTKRTDISYELIDAEAALKKAPTLLKIELNKPEVKKVAAKLKADGAFDGKKELIVDGIKYIITRQREAL